MYSPLGSSSHLIQSAWQQLASAFPLLDGVSSQLVSVNYPTRAIELERGNPTRTYARTVLRKAAMSRVRKIMTAMLTNEGFSDDGGFEDCPVRKREAEKQAKREAQESEAEKQPKREAEEARRKSITDEGFNDGDAFTKSLRWLLRNKK